MPLKVEIPADDIRLFEALRPRLHGLAYRILSSSSDAEDAVQDTFLKWAQADRIRVENPAGWLVTACTRRCLDLRRSADRRRIDYVGTWLPEPVQTSITSEADAQVELASSLSVALLMAMERLTPKERAAFLLHDIFDLSHADVAQTLDISAVSARQLVSRARRNVGRAQVRCTPSSAQQDAFLKAFEDAVSQGRVGALSEMLAKDAKLTADGGGKVAAVMETIQGRDAVCAFITDSLGIYWVGCDWVAVDLNGTRGLLISEQGRTTAAVTFAYDDAGRASDIFIVRNPDKLLKLDPSRTHARAFPETPK